MSDRVAEQLRVLVAIASYGMTNAQYLARLIEEYRSMTYSVDIIVLSNIPKELGSDVEVIIGLPTSDPRSLPFGHKQVFADRLDEYDLFLYSEDDTLITQKNIDAFLRASTVLSENEVAGFIRFETDADGEVFYPDVHGNYHWDVRSIRIRKGHTFAFFTNEHSACYILTREQLQRSIESGGFLVGPHQGKYDLLCSAATDPYTQCGFRKLICVSSLTDFVIHHLPNKYARRLGAEKREVDYQISAILAIAANNTRPTALLNTHPEFQVSALGKNYYEPTREDLIGLIPESVRSVLSVGCGWGATEKGLAERGKKVVSIALDPVISACAQARGLEIVQGDLNGIVTKLAGSRFDCLLISNVLHQVQDPGEFLAMFTPLLADRATVITAVPNLVRLSVLWRRLRRTESHKFLGYYPKSGVHFTSRRTIRKWLRLAGLRLDRFVDLLPERTHAVCRSTFGVMSPFVSSEIVAVAEAKVVINHGATC